MTNGWEIVNDQTMLQDEDKMQHRSISKWTYTYVNCENTGEVVATNQNNGGCGGGRETETERQR